MWLQVSSSGSKECHGYTTLGEIFRRLQLTGSVWQQRRFNFIIHLAELIVQKKLINLSGTSRKHFFVLIETLVNRVVETHERIRQMKKLIRALLVMLMRQKTHLIGSKISWFAQVDLVRKWQSRLNRIDILPRFDMKKTIADLPIYIQRHIIYMLDDHQDIENLSKVSQTLWELCNEPVVWKNLCHGQFTRRQLEECEAVLERVMLGKIQRGEKDNTEITWKKKYHFMIKRFERTEKYADPLLLCRRCLIVFWEESGHPCVGVNEVYEQIDPKKLISFF